jgi:hypothetical protein
LLTPFLDKLTGLFDRRFLVSCWWPTFTAGALALAGWVFFSGPAAFWTWWTGLGGSLQAVLGVAGLLAVTFAAFVVQARSFALLRLFEGYWPAWVAEQPLAVRLKKHHQETRELLLDRQTNDDVLARYYHYPQDGELVKPTLLGNTLTSAEEYPHTRYGLEAVVWWPRLVQFLPAGLSAQLDTAFTWVITLLNFSALLAGLGALGGAALLLADLRWWIAAILAAAALFALAWICYQSAVSHAATYGDLIRVGFDLYRHEVLKQMSIPLPETLREEYALWQRLNTATLHSTILPRERPGVGTVPATDPEFRYARSGGDGAGGGKAVQVTGTVAMVAAAPAAEKEAAPSGPSPGPANQGGKAEAKPAPSQDPPAPAVPKEWGDG